LHRLKSNTPGNRNPTMTAFLLLALGIAAFGAFAGYVTFCDRV
jgi:hypothetical protein